MNQADAFQVLLMDYPDAKIQLSTVQIRDKTGPLHTNYALHVIGQDGDEIDCGFGFALEDVVRTLHTRAVRGRERRGREALEAAFRRVVAGGKAVAK